MTARRPSRGPASILLAVLVAIVLGACTVPAASGPGVRPGGSPSVEAAPASSPSPTEPPDVVARFRAVIGDPGFSARVTITGEIAIGDGHFPITGTAAFRGLDHQEAMAMSTPGAEMADEARTVDGVRYERRDGLWFQMSPGTGDGPGGTNLAAALYDIVDLGIVTREGRALHHLTARDAVAVPLSAFGVADPTGDGVVSVDLYVTEDGAPAAMVIEAAWTAFVGATPEAATMTIEYAYAGVGSPVVIAKPDQVWTTFTSDRYGYAIAYPLDWEAQQSPGWYEPDTLASAAGIDLWVWRHPTEGDSLDQLVSGYVGWLESPDVRGDVTADEATTLDGEQARRLEYTVVADGNRQWEQAVMVVRGDSAYCFAICVLHELTEADRGLFDQLLSTVDLAG
jgi:hypothetical protein